ncbi:phage virion morphogenesis protein [Polycladidibacter stylochi]|uniref:phage virion morphogenesis protein n=1 Tax=Polycladidibacter stylochi TaxID=1807766 RepID=UPI00083495CC|nr:phage virion morphogenesis protein [Pseudovibrio stylochi]
MSTGFTVDFPIDEISRAISALTDLRTFELRDAIGALVVSQTQRRIDEEKTSPSGEPWAANREGSETLVKTGALRDTIDLRLEGDDIIVGTPMIYGAIHQFGGTIVPKEAQHLVFNAGGRKIFAKQVTIPARPFLGLSADNTREIEELVTDILTELIE